MDAEPARPSAGLACRLLRTGGAWRRRGGSLERAFGWSNPVGKVIEQAAPVNVVATLVAWTVVLFVRASFFERCLTAGPYSA